MLVTRIEEADDDADVAFTLTLSTLTAGVDGATDLRRDDERADVALDFTGLGLTMLADDDDKDEDNDSNVDDDMLRLCSGVAHTTLERSILSGVDDTMGAIINSSLATFDDSRRLRRRDKDDDEDDDSADDVDNDDNDGG